MFRSFPHVAETESSINKWFTIYVVEASLQVTIANNMQQQLFCGTGCIRNTIRGRWNIRNSDWEWVSFLKQIRRAANMGTEISTDTSTLGKQNVSKSAKGDDFYRCNRYVVSVSVLSLDGMYQYRLHTSKGSDNFRGYWEKHSKKSRSFYTIKGLIFSD